MGNVTAREDRSAEKIAGLRQQGYSCSQILTYLGLENQGMCNWDVVRCVEGLKEGFGFSGGICGALSGGVCLLGLYAGKGPVHESPLPPPDAMVNDLLDWFHDTVRLRHGSVQCEEITREIHPGELVSVCSSIVADTYRAAASILQSHGFDLSHGRTGLSADQDE